MTIRMKTRSSLSSSRPRITLKSASGFANILREILTCTNSTSKTLAMESWLWRFWLNKWRGQFSFPRSKWKHSRTIMTRRRAILTQWKFALASAFPSSLLTTKSRTIITLLTLQMWLRKMVRWHSILISHCCNRAIGIRSVIRSSWWGVRPVNLNHHQPKAFWQKTSQQAVQNSNRNLYSTRSLIRRLRIRSKLQKGLRLLRQLTRRLLSP